MAPMVRIDYDALYRSEMIPHMDPLYNYALRLTNNVEDAKDLLQETYLKAFRFIDQYKRETNARAWLFRILKNSFINNYRKKSRTPQPVEYEMAEEFGITAERHDYSNTDTRSNIFDRVFGDDVITAMDSLSDEFRTIIILSDIEEMTYEEIAEILDIPSGTVRSRLHRARKAMQEKLYSFAVKHSYITKKRAEEFTSKKEITETYAGCLSVDFAGSSGRDE